MVSQTEADPGNPPGLVPCLGRLPDGEIFAALVWSNKLSVMVSMVWPDKINADTFLRKVQSATAHFGFWINPTFMPPSRPHQAKSALKRGPI